ncbi:hypothetical protein BE20_44085 [Sorangium cellulosum]|nr:hypothetical protein BE20_44085 [Sorangium cellulosum]
MSRRVVITGIGLVAPNGIGKDAVWGNILAKLPAIGHITKFEPDGFPVGVGGEVSGFDPLDFMPSRLARKLDAFTQYAIAASDMAMKDAELQLDKVDKNRFGVFVGNCFGGWHFAEREIRSLHTQGLRAVSPFQATAWFPAAPQGQISILFGLKGHSKTIVCDRASGLASVGYGARAVAEGRADVVLAGGAEAPLTPLMYLACLTDGVMIREPDRVPSASYRPFDAGRRGIVPGEGAAFLLLEDREHAIRRNARIYAEISGFGMATDACHPAPLPAEELGLSAAMRKALDDGDVAASAVSFVMADGMATRDGDHQEAAAIHEVFGARGRQVPVTAPKSMTGHLYGASGAMDVAIAAMALQRRVVPPTSNLDVWDAQCDLAIATEPMKNRMIEHVLVNGRGSGGINAALVISDDGPDLEPSR